MHTQIYGRTYTVSALTLENARQLAKSGRREPIRRAPTTYWTAFHVLHGRSPHQHRILQKLVKACELLDTTNLRHVDIACEVGMSDEQDLSKRFRCWTGMTPKQWRRLRRYTHNDEETRQLVSR